MYFLRARKSFLIILCSIMTLMSGCRILSPQGGGGTVEPPSPPSQSSSDSQNAGSDPSEKSSLPSAAVPSLPAGEVTTRYDHPDRGYTFNNSVRWICTDRGSYSEAEISGHMVRPVSINQFQDITAADSGYCDGHVMRIVNPDKKEYLDTRMGYDSNSGTECFFRLTVDADFLEGTDKVLFYFRMADGGISQLDVPLACPAEGCVDWTVFQQAWNGLIPSMTPEFNHLSRDFSCASPEFRNSVPRISMEDFPERQVSFRK